MEKSQEEVLWQTILGEIEVSMSHATFATWFKPTELLSIQGQNLQVLVNNFFAKNQFEKKFDEQIKHILKKNGFSAPTIEYIIKGKRVAKEEVVDEKTALPSVEPSEPKNPTGLNAKYRFDNFIVGACNDLAYAASQAAAAMPGQKYNPIFIYGGSGLGKTHLIEAIGNEILVKQPGLRVLYASAETFGNEFIDYVRFKKNRDFGKKYRDVDVLIIDDVQFIAGKKSTQEEFFNTFNSLHQADKQIVLTADKPPSEIPGLVDRLRSRFQMGMAIATKEVLDTFAPENVYFS